MTRFIDEYRERFGVEPICRELETSDSAYYQRRKDAPSQRARRDAELVEKLRRVYQQSDETYGAWRAWKQLNREGMVVARCTVERLMRRERLEGIRRGKQRRTTVPAQRPVSAPDLVKRRFTATRPDEVWVADFTYVRTWQGWSYLAIVVDVYTRLIVGWQLASHMRQELVEDALAMAIAARPTRSPALIHHGDNGAQYASWTYTTRLADAGIRPSRGRTGTALDNAMAESVIATRKTELVKRRPWPTRLDFELALVAYIGWYNTERIHRRLNGLTPAEKDHQYQQNPELETTKT